MKDAEKFYIADGVKPVKNAFFFGYSDTGLKEPVRSYEETLSAFDVVAQRFFGE